MKITIKLTCFLLAALLCLSMAACQRTITVESYVSMPGDESDSPSDNSDATTTTGAESQDTTEKTSAGDNKVSTTTTKSTKKRQTNDTVYRNVTVSKGSTKLETTYKDTFKGKKYTAIIWTEVMEGFNEELQAFAKQYGCTITLKSVNFETVNTALSTALASSEPYDIIRVQGSWYPRIITQGLLAPLDGTFTTADLTTDSNHDGIDLEKSKYFAWNDQLYAITTYDDAPLYYLYYNKQLLNGANDPWTLYKKGEWTWAKMKEIASKFTGLTSTMRAYWSDQAITSKALPLANNVHLLKETKKSDGGTKLEVSISGNTGFINALKYVQGLNGTGKGGAGTIYESKQVLAQDGDSDKFKNLLNGTVAVWPSENNRYQKLYSSIAKEGVGFNYNVANLGVAPFPLGPDNTAGAYPCGWLTGFAAGKGSDATAPKLVAALCKFHSTYTGGDTTSKAAQAEADVKKTMEHLYANINYCDFGYGTTRKENMDIVLSDIETAVRTGQDITSTLKSYDSKAAGYLKDSLSQQ